MKLNHLLTAAAACALLGGAAHAQSNAAQPGERTGDWNGAHAPTDGSLTSERVQPSHGTSVTTVTTTTAEPYDTAPVADAAVAPDATADVSATAPSVTTTLVTNGPVPDTAENRARFGGPMSLAGKMTAARGN
ncbi:hypothetical protein [Phenylobacterium sp. J367]|uniref:hypothetical protein n=1 Tax=Phenylobacterium sp. J367 TaxID=2898435 RepID=UPI00215101F6|nr:hypothetical protein [Phenylobacterium sp. J367]MCR5879982.1 hypothetical protein [Phenylobacterium sp. J367]